MKKGIFPKLSMGLALAGALALTSATRVNADLAGTVSYTEPAETLVMPWDVTTGHQTFHIVSRLGAGDSVIATHWSFWSEACDHKADVFICLTNNDTVVVDPTDLHSEFQKGNENVPGGNNANLTGFRGLVTVTAFVASSDSIAREECAVDNVQAPTTVADQIVGAWTIANTGTGSAFGNDAIGLSTNQFVGDEAATFLGSTGDPIPFFVQTFNPTSLQDSEVIVLTVEFPAGHGNFADFEIGPIKASDDPKVCCQATFTDNLEDEISLENYCFDCAGFAPISDNVAQEGETAIIGPQFTINSSGFVSLFNCTTTPPGEDTGIVGETNPQFLLGFHGQAVGQFGAVVKTKFTGGLETNS